MPRARGTSDFPRGPTSRLTDPLPIRPGAGARGMTSGGRAPCRLTYRPPGSKSLTNRALLLAALTNGRSVLHRPLVDGDDAKVMVAALRTLGATIEVTPDRVIVDGVGGQWRPSADALKTGAVLLQLQNAGTATRFLAATALLSPVSLVVDGNARMRERPIAELAEALEQLGVKVAYWSKRGCPPIQLTPPAEGGTRQGEAASSTVTLGTTISSQFISALLLVAPWLASGLTLRLEGEVTSASYISMTVGLLDKLGALVRTSEDLRVIRVAAESPGAGVKPFELEVEPDASSATPLWAAAALIPGAVCRIEGLDQASLQGDAQFPELLARMGATVTREEGTPKQEAAIGCRGAASISPIMADLSQMPDAAMTLAAVASFASGRSILRGLRTLRHKETDRLEAIRAELAKVGVACETSVLGDPDAMVISPPKGGIDCSASAPRVEFDTYDDHRMAMSMALIGLRRPNVFIRNPACVGKTFPGFWEVFEAFQGAGK